MGSSSLREADKSTDAPSASTSSPLAPQASELKLVLNNMASKVSNMGVQLVISAQAEASPVPAEASATESAAEPNEEPLESPEKLPEKTAPHAEKAQDTAPEKEKAASPSSRQETILIEAQAGVARSMRRELLG